MLQTILKTNLGKKKVNEDEVEEGIAKAASKVIKKTKETIMGKPGLAKRAKDTAKKLKAKATSPEMKDKFKRKITIDRYNSSGPQTYDYEKWIKK